MVVKKKQPDAWLPVHRQHGGIRLMTVTLKPACESCSGLKGPIESEGGYPKGQGRRQQGAAPTEGHEDSERAACLKQDKHTLRSSLAPNKTGRT